MHNLIRMVVMHIKNYGNFYHDARIKITYDPTLTMNVINIQECIDYNFFNDYLWVWPNGVLS